MNYINYLKKENSIINFSSIIIFFSIFLWDFKINLPIGSGIIAQSKYLIIILLLYNLILFKKSDLKYYFYFLSFCALLTLHLYIVNINKPINIFNDYIVFSILFLFIYFLVLYKIHPYFSIILSKTITLFMLFANFIFIIEIVSGNFTLYDFEKYFNGLCIIFHKENYLISQIIFSENSHLGMISAAIILYSFFQFTEKNKVQKINILLFTLGNLFFFLSLTVMIGILFTSITLLIFGLFRKNRSKLYFLIPIILSLGILITIDNCWSRIYQVLNLEIIYLENNNNTIALNIEKKLTKFKGTLANNHNNKTYSKDKLQNFVKKKSTLTCIERKLEDRLILPSKNILYTDDFDIIKSDCAARFATKPSLSSETKIADLSSETKIADLSSETKIADLSSETKIADLYSETKIADLYSETKIAEQSQSPSTINNELKKIRKEIKLITDINNIDYVMNRSINATTIVHINHYIAAFEAIDTHPLGYGFQNYQSAANDHARKTKMIKSYDTLKTLNYNDGSNNFNKLIAEFGYLNLLLLFLFIIFFIKSNLTNTDKVFIFGILITQMFRAAGYFNGGFLFIIISGYFSIFIKQKDYKSINKK